jgi:hypothetical protein
VARIRTIKPEFFRHRRLYLAEKESRLPLRVAFAGLWTCADREGRFQWEPEELKLDCLPYDDMDFSRVLDALTTRGFVIKYESGGRTFGVIPGFKRHQVINNRERESEIPKPPNVVIDIRTGEPRVPDASPTRHDPALVEGKGREGKGKEQGTSKDRADALPDWLPQGPWDAWLEVRKKNRAPNTPRALDLAVRELEKLRGQGHDPAAVLDNATLRGWRGLYPPALEKGSAPDYSKVIANLKD